MADSDDDFGDDFDASALLEAATQAERDSPAFPPSPHPTKRRRLQQPSERPRHIPPSKHPNQRLPFVSSDDDFSAAERTAPIPRRKKRPSIEVDDGDTSSAVTSANSATRKKRAKSRSDYDDEEPWEEESPKKETVAVKRKSRIHVPTNKLDLTEHYLTQPPREPSPPWMPRGAIWQKQKSIGVYRPPVPDAVETAVLLSRGSVASKPISRAAAPPEKTAPIIDFDQSPKLPTPRHVSAVYDPAQELADLPSDAFASSSSSPRKEDDLVIVSEKRTKIVAPQTGLRQTTLFGRAGPNGVVPASQANKRYNCIVDQKEEPPSHHKLDREALKTWVYPTNLGKIRDYQFNIVQRGLFHNLLVALPTGLGKTFIAATIMLNWFRWTTEAQIAFLAPTKPLVSQQVEACFNIVGIPRSQTVLLTGETSPALRADEYSSKRVFFMTSQTLINDLRSGIADPKRFVLLVVDEAHRATGNHTYVQVVEFLRRFNSSFRILALTATPGADIEAVQKVIDGLDISKIEIRTENSLDISQYVHQRNVEKHVFGISDEMQMCMDLYSQALQPCVNRVAGLNAFYSNNPLDITPYGCTLARQKWYQEAGRHANQGQKAMVQAAFTVLGTISHGMDLLKYHGIKPFYLKMKEFRDEQAKSKSKYRKEICDSEAFKKLMVRLSTWTSNEDFIGHPKLEFLQQVVLDHFVNATDGAASDDMASQTRIMVFAHFRDSAEDIVRVLRRHRPMIRPSVFVGQATSKNSEGMDQNTQLDVMAKFKKGAINTLVATSIGEEGLDIGEVDLIICYDSKASPIRMLQRMGRTGRKREGKIVMLQMEGKEERDALKAKDSYEKMQELIAEGSRFTFHDDRSRRILPRDVQPAVERKTVEIPLENSQADCLPVPKKKRGRPAKKPPKKFHMPDGVLTGFVTAGRMDEEIGPKSRQKKASSIYPSQEVVPWPPLEHVLLDDSATADLEQKYQTVFDEDVIGALDLSKHVGEQRQLCRAHNFHRNGRVTQSLVATLQRMHAMDDARIKQLQSNLHSSDYTTMPANSILVSDTEDRPAVTEDMWADDDPASQPLAKPKPKPRARAKTATEPKPKSVKEEAFSRPRGRPRKDASVQTPARKPRMSSDMPETPQTKTPNWRVSGLAGEAASSSPPPTDPRMRIASQAETIGSDDTVGPDVPQDTQAYRLDSDLVSFIAEDDEDVGMEMTESSLLNTSFAGIGRGTQAVLKDAISKRPKRLEKIFSSDPTDDDAVVSSDSEDDVLVCERKSASAKERIALNSDSSCEEEEPEPVVARKRQRRVIDDDDDDE